MVTSKQRRGENWVPMEATATTIVTALINEGRQQYGVLEAIEVPQELLDQVMDEVVEAGGDVGFDSCVVDGVTVVAGGTEAGEPLVRLPGRDEPAPLRTGAG